MAATWTIRKLNYLNNDPSGHEKVVDEVYFAVTDDNALPFPSPIGRYEGSVSLRPLDLSSFTEWDNLTEAQVLNWVTSVLGAQAMTDLETGIAADIAAQGHPREGRGVPW